MNQASSDPFVFLTLGKKSKKTKTQDEDNKKPVWNETVLIERTDSDESAVLFWILDEGNKNAILGYTALSVYPAIFSKLNEKYHLPLFFGNSIIGELILHMSFKSK